MKKRAELQISNKLNQTVFFKFSVMPEIMNAKFPQLHLLDNKQSCLLQVSFENLRFKNCTFDGFSDPEVTVLGGPDLFINAGSFINLTCIGDNLPGIPEDVYWYHEKQVKLHLKGQ